MKRLSGGECRELNQRSPHVHCGVFHGGWYFVTDPNVPSPIAAHVVRNGAKLSPTTL
jgi:hypothetical protein